MTLSMHGETLFHFTDELSNLKAILESSYFKASFSLEKLSYESPTNGSTEIPELWVPMVSFCDYKLSEIGHHVLNYGPYGLGMSKQWGIDKGLNPVLYVSEHSQIGDKLRIILTKVAQAKLEGNIGDQYQQILGDTDIDIANFYSWTKNYQGTLTRKGAKIYNFRFADDKEWRYVAKIDYSSANKISSLFRDGYLFIPVPQVNCPCCMKPAKSCQNGGQGLLKVRKEECKSLIQESTSTLNFSDCDITFILVKCSDDKNEILQMIEQDSTRTSFQKLYMASKIIVIDELDFRDLAPVQRNVHGAGIL